MLLQWWSLFSRRSQPIGWKSKHPIKSPNCYSHGSLLSKLSFGFSFVSNVFSRLWFGTELSREYIGGILRGLIWTPAHFDRFVLRVVSHFGREIVCFWGNCKQRQWTLRLGKEVLRRASFVRVRFVVLRGEWWRGRSRQPGSRLVGRRLGSSWQRRRRGSLHLLLVVWRSLTGTGLELLLFVRYVSIRSLLSFWSGSFRSRG